MHRPALLGESRRASANPGPRVAPAASPVAWQAPFGQIVPELRARKPEPFAGPPSGLADFNRFVLNC
jgi:hypothetical protein